MNRSMLCAQLTVACTLLAPALGGDVLTVAPPGTPADYTLIQAAIDAANDGDTILIVPAMGYESVLEIDNKDLALLIDGGGPTTFQSVFVSNLPANKRIHIDGMRGHLSLSDCAGEVLIANWKGAALTADACSRVTAVDCIFNGSDGGEGEDGGTACWISASSVAFYSSTGNGGDGGFSICLGGAPSGGDGLRVDNQSLVRVVNSSFVGGDGGFTPCDDGFSGDDESVSPDSILEHSTHPPAGVAAPGTVREGEAFVLEVTGPPGAEVRLITSTDWKTRFLPAGIGVLHTLLPAATEQLGPIPASGVLSIPMVAPSLGFGDEARTRFLQAVVAQSGSRFLSNPRALTVLDGVL